MQKENQTRSLWASIRIFLVASISVFLIESCAPRTAPFDSVAWKERDHGERYVMVEDLLARYDLANLDTNEIIELLGPPMETLPPFMGEKTVLAYYVGPRQNEKKEAILTVVKRDQLPGDKYRIYLFRPYTILD